MMEWPSWKEMTGGVRLFAGVVLVYALVRAFRAVGADFGAVVHGSEAGWTHVTGEPIVGWLLVAPALLFLFRLKSAWILLLAGLALDGVEGLLEKIELFLGDRPTVGLWWKDRSIFAPAEHLLMNLGVMALLWTPAVKDWLRKHDPRVVPDSAEESGIMGNRKWSGFAMTLISTALLLQSLHGRIHDPSLLRSIPYDNPLREAFWGFPILAGLFTALTIALITGGKSKKGVYGKFLAGLAFLFPLLFLGLFHSTFGQTQTLKILPWPVLPSLLILMVLALLRTGALDRAYRWS